VCILLYRVTVYKKDVGHVSFSVSYRSSSPSVKIYIAPKVISESEVVMELLFRPY